VGPAATRFLCEKAAKIKKTKPGAGEKNHETQNRLPQLGGRAAIPVFLLNIPNTRGKQKKKTPPQKGGPPLSVQAMKQRLGFPPAPPPVAPPPPPPRPDRSMPGKKKFNRESESADTKVPADFQPGPGFHVFFLFLNIPVGLKTFSTFFFRALHGPGPPLFKLFIYVFLFSPPPA